LRFLKRPYALLGGRAVDALVCFKVYQILLVLLVVALLATWLTLSLLRY